MIDVTQQTKKAHNYRNETTLDGCDSCSEALRIKYNSFVVYALPGAPVKAAPKKRGTVAVTFRK